MFRKKDVIVIGIVLLLAAIIYGVMMVSRSTQTLSGTVEIYTGGTLYATARLDEPQALSVTQPDGAVNTVTIQNGQVSMTYSSCKNQLCVHQGAISADNWMRRAMGRTIVCLPNSVLVELALDEGHPSLLDDDLPDI